MIATSSLQSYEKVIEYGWFFWKKIKIIAKILGTFRNNAYLCSVRMYVLAIRVESRVG
jgi:hypothetical protein